MNIYQISKKNSYENKNKILLGDFNINLLGHGKTEISDFLDSMCSNSFFPFITQPTRITPKSKTLIDNIFLNFHSPDIKSGNLTVTLADHLAQFLLIEDVDKDVNLKRKV